MTKTAEQEDIEARIVAAALTWNECQNAHLRADHMMKYTLGPNGSTKMIFRYEARLNAHRAEHEMLRAESDLTDLTDRLIRLRAEQAQAESDREMAGEGKAR